MVKVRSDRRGSSLTGCVVWLVVCAIVAYYGFHIGQRYWVFYQLQDEMQSQARLAPGLNDATIRRRVMAKVDELGLPIQPKDLKIQRGGRPARIVIEAEYTDSLSLPLVQRVIVHHPRVEEPL